MRGHREQRGTPTTVTPRSAEPDGLGLQNRDPETGIGLRQVVRRPQAGIPGTDDRNVGVQVTGKPRPVVTGKPRPVVTGEPWTVRRGLRRPEVQRTPQE